MQVLTCEIHPLLQVHQCDIGLFGASVVGSVDNDTIDSSGLNIHRGDVALRVKPEDG